MSELPYASLPVAVGLRDTYIGSLDETMVGRTITVCGWVDKVREHGEHLVFVDLRDYSGVVQCVLPSRDDLRSEYVVAVTALVALRPEGTTNPGLPTGGIELRECELTVHGISEPTPFSLSDRIEVDESTRLRHRYLDIRRDRLQGNLRLRARVNAAIRRSMEQQGFVEVETPLLWTPTPEGAREFVVPSRLQHGSSYVLPQSPQIAKQLLMVGGMDRYYQIARCMRDEDLRADRQFEFTQLDLEASFVRQEDVLEFISEAIRTVVRNVRDEEIGEIGQITWRDAMDLYGSDKPDRRFGHPLIDVTSVFENTEARALQAPTIKALVAFEPERLTRSKIDALIERAKSLGAKGLLWLRVVEGPEGLTVDSPISKFLKAPEIAELIDATAAVAGDVLLLLGDEWQGAVEVLGQIRLEQGRPHADPELLDFFWVVDFPLFEGVDNKGNLISAHHPFTMPNEEDFDLLESDPIKVRSQSYDLVVNGWELGSGSIRIHRGDIQSKIFSVLGIDEATAHSRFGFLLDAFKYGAPPHGGFAFGIDRLVATLAGEENIREVIAFPKTQSGTDLMTGAPKPIDESQWKLLGLAPQVVPTDLPR